MYCIYTYFCIFLWNTYKSIYIYTHYASLCICPCPCPLPCQGTKAACKPQLSHKGRFSSSGISGSNSKCTKYTGSAWVAKRVSSLPDEEKIWFMAFWTRWGWCVFFLGGISVRCWWWFCCWNWDGPDGRKKGEDWPQSHSTRWHEKKSQVTQAIWNAQKYNFQKYHHPERQAFWRLASISGRY